MTIDRRTLLGSGIALTAAGVARAQGTASMSADPLAWPARETIDLWPKRPPGAPASLSAIKGVAMPTLSVYRAAKPDGRGVLSIPGGGYTSVSVENEGVNIARELNPYGITVFVLNYRLPGDGWTDRADVPLQDAQRAMRIVRARANRFGIDSAKLGILGFSAGGHLGAVLATAYDDRVYSPVDAADRQSARPDFAGLIYPVTTVSLRGPRSGSRDNLLGDKPDPATVARHAAESRVDLETPPVFLLHAIDDPIVPVEMSLSMMASCRAAGIPVEAHLYEKGGHGFGVGNDPDHPARGWTERFARWSATHV